MLATIRRLDDPNAAVPSPAAVDHQDFLLRLACFAFEILRQHSVDDHGRCRRCRPSRSGCRRWLRWPTRKAPCLILSVASFYSTVPTEHVWFQILPHLGIHRELQDIRDQLARLAATSEHEPVWPTDDELTQPGVTSPVPTIPMPSVEAPSGRHALSA